MKGQLTKYLLFAFVAFLIVSLTIQISCQSAERKSGIVKDHPEYSADRSKVDSIFQANFAILDAVSEKKHTAESYSLYRVNEVTDILVSLSGIEPTVDMTYIGWMDVNEEDVIKWKEWYDQNKHRLKWDEEKREVVLEPDPYKQTENFRKVDSIFQMHFAILDRYIQGSEVSIDSVNQAIDFFEALTTIKSSAVYTLYGRFQVTESEVEAWKQWYKDNADKLKWDEEKQKVIVVE